MLPVDEFGLDLLGMESFESKEKPITDHGSPLDGRCSNLFIGRSRSLKSFGIDQCGRPSTRVIAKYIVGCPMGSPFLFCSKHASRPDSPPRSSDYSNFSTHLDMLLMSELSVSRNVLIFTDPEINRNSFDHLSK
jgi:hypothetical protein